MTRRNRIYLLGKILGYTPSASGFFGSSASCMRRGTSHCGTSVTKALTHWNTAPTTAQCMEFPVWCTMADRNRGPSLQRARVFPTSTSCSAMECLPLCAATSCAAVCRAARCCAARCRAARCCAAMCRAAMCCAAMRCTVLRCAALCCAALRCAALCGQALHDYGDRMCPR